MTQSSPPVRSYGRLLPILISVALGTPMLGTSGEAQPNDNVESIDACIDSLLLEHPEFYGLTVDSMVLRQVSDPHIVGAIQGTATRVGDLAEFHRGRTLPAYTRSEGFVLALGSEQPAPIFVTDGIVVAVSGGGGYAFGMRRWQWRLGAEVDLFWPKHPLRLAVEGHDIVDTREQWKCGDVENSLAALLAGVDARHRYAQRTGITGSVLLIPVPVVAVGVTVESDLYATTQRIADWSLFGPSQPFAEIPKVVTGRLNSITPRLAIGTYRDGDKGGSGLRAGFDTRVEFGHIDTMTYRQATIVARMRWWPLSYRLQLAGQTRVVISEGTVPEQRRESFGGFGTIPAQPLHAYHSSSSAYWSFELLVRPFDEAGTPTLADLAFIAGTELCTIRQPQGGSTSRGGVGLYVATSNGKLRTGFAVATDGPLDVRFAMRLSTPF